MSHLPTGLEAQARPIITRDTAPNPARMRRETLVLDGVWSLVLGDGASRGASQPVLVPFAPQARVNGIRLPEGPDGAVSLLYRTTFEIPSDWEGAVLHFEGVDREAEVRLNGHLLGHHAGAYDPFGFFVPQAVLDLGLDGDLGPELEGPAAPRLHMVEVVVRDSSRDRHVAVGKQERKPGEGNIFYGNMSGLWKSVWIERAGEARIGEMRIEARASGWLSAEVEVAGAAAGQRLALRLRREGLPDLQAEAPVVAGAGGGLGVGLARFDLRVEGVRPWSPEAPRLYDATLSLLGEDGAALDALDTYMGFRDFEMRDGYYRLNGEPFQLRGLLNQAIYPDTLYTPTDAHTLRDYEETLSHGFNGERRHQTTPRHRDLWLADRMGYWLSIELPSARNLRNDAHRAAAVAEWTRIVRAYAWHPCVLYLAPGNENWGLLNDPHHETGASAAEREAFQYELGEATEACAPRGIPYAANDGWKLVTARRRGATQNRLDPSRLMFNLHDYAANSLLRSIYGRLPRFPKPDTWSWNARYVFHDASYSYDGRTPIILSEVGGRACLNRPAKGVFAYGRVHHDPEAWGEELGELIELMGNLPVLRGGYVLTQTRDAGNDPDDPTSRGEINGILDADGAPKLQTDRIRRANAHALEAWRRHLGTGATA
jgi:hypothetical protein